MGISCAPGDGDLCEDVDHEEEDLEFSPSCGDYPRGHDIDGRSGCPPVAIESRNYSAIAALLDASFATSRAWSLDRFKSEFPQLYQTLLADFCDDKNIELILMAKVFPYMDVNIVFSYSVLGGAAIMSRSVLSEDDNVERVERVRSMLVALVNENVEFSPFSLHHLLFLVNHLPDQLLSSYDRSSRRADHSSFWLLHLFCIDIEHVKDRGGHFKVEVRRVRRKMVADGFELLAREHGLMNGVRTTGLSDKQCVNADKVAQKNSLKSIVSVYHPLCSSYVETGLDDLLQKIDDFDDFDDEECSRFSSMNPVDLVNFVLRDLFGLNESQIAKVMLIANDSAPLESTTKSSNDKRYSVPQHLLKQADSVIAKVDERYAAEAATHFAVILDTMIAEQDSILRPINIDEPALELKRRSLFQKISRCWQGYLTGIEASTSGVRDSVADTLSTAGDDVSFGENPIDAKIFEEFKPKVFYFAKLRHELKQLVLKDDVASMIVKREEIRNCGVLSFLDRFCDSFAASSPDENLQAIARDMKELRDVVEKQWGIFRDIDFQEMLRLRAKLDGIPRIHTHSSSLPSLPVDSYIGDGMPGTGFALRGGGSREAVEEFIASQGTGASATYVPGGEEGERKLARDQMRAWRTRHKR